MSAPSRANARATARADARVGAGHQSFPAFQQAVAPVGVLSMVRRWVHRPCPPEVIFILLLEFRLRMLGDGILWDFTVACHGNPPKTG